MDDFPGAVTVDASHFQDNVFRYEACGRLGDTDLRALGDEPLLRNARSVPLKNNMKRVYRKANTAFDKVQLKSLISVRNHNYTLAILKNTFERNSGTKGIIVLEKATQGKGMLIL